MAVVISALDLYYFVKELIPQLVGGKVEQIYQHDATSLTIRFYKAGAGKVDLFIAPPKGLYVTTNKPAASTEQFGFCGILRKYLPNLTLESIEQLGFSRTIRFNFVFRDTATRFALVVELYDKGNILLLDADQKILAPLQTQRWQNRIVAAGQPFTVDKSPLPQDLTDEYVASTANAAAAESMSTSKFAATKFNLGGAYGLFLCNLAQISPTVIISADEARKLHATLAQLFTQKLQPCVGIDSDARIISAHPFTHPALGRTQPVDSLSAAYEKSLMLHDKPKENPQLRATTAAQKKFKGILDAQQASIDQLTREAAHNQHIGEQLYNDYARFESLLSQIQSAVHNKDKVLLAKLGVKKHDSVNKTVVLAIPDTASNAPADTTDAPTGDEL